MPNPFCPHCGAPLSGGERYCPRCGRKIQKGRVTIVSIVGYGIAVLVLALIWILVIIPAWKEKRADSHTSDRNPPVSADDEGNTGPSVESREEPEYAEEESESIPEEIQLEPLLEAEEYLPFVCNKKLETGLEELGIQRSDAEIEYVFSDNINRGCIVDAYEGSNGIRLSVSKGREYTYIRMRKREGNNSIGYMDEYSFNEDGISTQAVKYGGDGNVIYRFNIDYDENGMETGQTFYTAQGEYHHSWEFRYDRHGRLVLSRKYFKGGEELQREEYQYDDSGRIVSRKDYQNGALTYIWQFEDYDETITPLSYDTHIGGNWTYATISDASGNQIRYATQSFDEYGAIEEMCIWTESGGDLIYSYEFESGLVG